MTLSTILSMASLAVGVACLAFIWIAFNRVADLEAGFEPHVSMDVDPRVYRDAESGRRFVVVRTSTTQYGWGPSARCTVTAESADHYFLDEGAERTTTIANALRSNARGVRGGRR